MNVTVRKLTRLGNQQPSHQNGGRFNDHPQGVGSSDPKRRASERMMIWSGLVGNYEQVDKAQDVVVLSRNNPNMEVPRENHTGTCQEVQREVGAGRINRMLELDSINSREGLRTNQVAQDAQAGVRSQAFVSGSQRRNTHGTNGVSQVRQSEVCEPRASVHWFTVGQPSGHEIEGSALVRRAEPAIETYSHCRNGNQRSVGQGFGSNANSGDFWCLTGHCVKNHSRNPLATPLVDLTGRGLTTHAEQNDYIGGFAITHNWGDTGETNSRIVKWDSKEA